MDILNVTLYLFPTIALAKYHNLGGLKQHKCICLQFWTSEILKVKHQQECVPSVDFGGEFISLFLPASRGHLRSLAGGPLAHITTTIALPYPGWDPPASFFEGLL